MGTNGVDCFVLQSLCFGSLKEVQGDRRGYTLWSMNESKRETHILIILMNIYKYVSVFVCVCVQCKAIFSKTLM